MPPMTPGMKALNRLTKWRNVFVGWQLGTREKGDPEGDAVRDHREQSIILRAEVTALTGLRCKEVEVESAKMVDDTVDLWVDRLQGFVARLQAEVKSRMQRTGRNSSVVFADFEEAIERAKDEVTALDWDTPARIDQALAKGAEEERERLLGDLGIAELYAHLPDLPMDEGDDGPSDELAAAIRAALTATYTALDRDTPTPSEPEEDK
jgi:hypothetical protein